MSSCMGLWTSTVASETTFDRNASWQKRARDDDEVTPTLLTGAMGGATRERSVRACQMRQGRNVAQAPCTQPVVKWGDVLSAGVEVTSDDNRN
eukprot:9775374-Alexandrium_andersonii.AAC.1